MRIAFFADSYKPYISGVTISIETLTAELRALGHRVYIFAPSYPGYVDLDQDVIRFPSIPTTYPKFRISIPYLKNIPEVDVIHSHTPFQTGLLARYLARKKKIPLVYTFHTLFTRYMHYAAFLPEKFSKLAMTSYLRMFCRRTDLIITPSEMSKRVLRKWKINQNCIVVPTGIAIPQQVRNGAARTKLGIPQDAKVLVYLGRISLEKNIPFILEAFEKLRNENIFLLLIGGGPMLAELKQRHIKNVIFAGELPHDAAVECLSAGDIFVFASKTETQGLLLAEAKAAGLPIVSLFAGGLVDTVQSGVDGYLTERNITSFVAHVDRLLIDDGLRKKMGAAALLDAKERFRSHTIAKRMESIYNSLIKK